MPKMMEHFAGLFERLTLQRTGALFNSDDMPMLAIVSLPTSVLCTIAMGIASYGDSTCYFRLGTRVYTKGMFFCWALSSALSFLIAFYGTRGNAFQSSLRNPIVPRLVNVSAYLRLAEMLFNCYGFYLIYIQSGGVCQTRITDGGKTLHAETLILVALWLTWISIFAFGLVSHILARQLKVKKEGKAKGWMSGATWIIKKLRCLGILDQDEVEALKSSQRMNTIARQMYHHFQPASMGPSDMVSAMCNAMLLQRVNHHHPIEVDDLQALSASHKPIQKVQPASSSDLDDAESILAYACAIYASSCTFDLVKAANIKEALESSWLFRSRKKLSNAWMKKAVNRGGHAFRDTLRRRHGIETLKERKDYEVLAAVVKREDADIVWYSETMAIEGLLPYAVIADPVLKKVIITIRGSASMKDMITDMMMQPVMPTAWIPPPLLEKCQGKEHYVHKGMLGAAKAILADLQRVGILHAMFESPDSESMADAAELDEEWPDAVCQLPNVNDPEVVHITKRAESRAIDEFGVDVLHSHEYELTNQAYSNDPDSAPERTPRLPASGSARKLSKLPTIEDTLISCDSPKSDDRVGLKGVRGRMRSYAVGEAVEEPTPFAALSEVAFERKKYDESNMNSQDDDGMLCITMPDKSPRRASTVVDPENNLRPQVQEKTTRLRSAHAQIKASADHSYARGTARPVDFLLDKYTNLAKQGWELEVTGQSLGAGVAALMALKLGYAFRNAVRTHCWAYSPPGGLMSPALAEAASEVVQISQEVQDRLRLNARESRPLVQSFVMGEDVITRANADTLARLRDQMVMATARSRVWKWRIILGCVSSRLRRRMGQNPKLFWDEDNLPEECRLRVAAYHENVEAVRQDAGLFLCHMQPPGRVLYLQRNLYLWEKDYEVQKMKPMWISGTDLLDDGILISKTMGVDHLPYNIWTELREMNKERTQRVGARWKNNAKLFASRSANKDKQ